MVKLKMKDALWLTKIYKINNCEGRIFLSCVWLQSLRDEPLDSTSLIIGTKSLKGFSQSS